MSECKLCGDDTMFDGDQYCPTCEEGLDQEAWFPYEKHRITV